MSKNSCKAAESAIARFCEWRGLNCYKLCVTVQPFGFTVTESVHLKLPTARGGFTLGKIYIFLRALQQVQSPTLNCYNFVPFILPITIKLPVLRHRIRLRTGSFMYIESSQ